MHTVFSTDASPYQQWQTELLSHSFRQVGQSGPITRLWAGLEEPTPFDGLTFTTPPYHYHPISGDYYPPYNRLFGLTAWLRDSPPPDTTILHIEPDFIFTSAFEVEVERGRPIAHPFWHMYLEYAPTVARRYCARPERIQPIGVPKIIHRDDLIEILPHWQAKTEAIRTDPEAVTESHWWSDMWGYVCAAAELGLEHQVMAFGHHPAAESCYPLVHYCAAISLPDGSWSWGKHHYQPWSRIPPPPPNAPYATRVIIRELNALADLKRGQS